MNAPSEAMRLRHAGDVPCCHDPLKDQVCSTLLARLPLLEPSLELSLSKALETRLESRSQFFWNATPEVRLFHVV